jgi:hypothetical protein
MVLFIIALSLGGIFGTATTLIRQSEDRVLRFGEITGHDHARYAGAVRAIFHQPVF